MWLIYVLFLILWYAYELFMMHVLPMYWPITHVSTIFTLIPVRHSDESCMISINDIPCIYICLIRKLCHEKYRSMTCIIIMYHDLKWGTSDILCHEHYLFSSMFCMDADTMIWHTLISFLWFSIVWVCVLAHRQA